MSIFYLLLCGFGAAGLLYFLWRKADKWYQWVIAILLYIWICFGISFVYINSVGYHHQAAARGGIFFAIIALIGGFVFARVMGYIGKKPGETEKASVEA